MVRNSSARPSIPGVEHVKSEHTSIGSAAMETNKAAKGTMWLWSALMVVCALASIAQGQALPPSAPVEFIPSGAAQGDNIGQAVALSREFAVIGAPGTDTAPLIGNGVAYVYKKSGGVWQLAQTLIPPQLGSSDRFGEAVAIFQAEPNSSETTRLIVGAPHLLNGKAYIYKLESNPEAWVLEKVLEPPNPSTTRSFGVAVSIAQDTAAVGDDMDQTHTQPPQLSRGMVYVYRFKDVDPDEPVVLDWERILPDLEPPDLTDWNNFGRSVAISRDGFTIAVGNPAGGTTGQGSVYIFNFTGLSYVYTAELLPCHDLVTDSQSFGNDVAIDGTAIAVGAPYFGSASLETYRQGSVYVFNRTGATWLDHECKQLSRYNAAEEDTLGWSVDMDGPIVIAGAPGYGSHLDYVNVYRLGTTEFTEGQWIEQPKMMEFGGSHDALFGHAVAIDEHIALTGAPDSDDNANSILDTGSFFIINTIVSIEPGCPGDIASDGSRFGIDEPDGFIGTADFFAVLQAWGSCAKPADCPADFLDANGVVGSDGEVSVNEFFFVLQHWGPCGVVDTDGDGISDFFENQYDITSFDDPTDAYFDHDSDGLSTLDEITLYQTHPNISDSDGDSVIDGAEVLAGADPMDGSDQGIGPDSDDIEYIRLQVGDTSLPGTQGTDTWAIVFNGVGYGAARHPLLTTAPIPIKRGHSYSIELMWVRSHNQYGPDYDSTVYVYLVDPQAPPEELGTALLENTTPDEEFDTWQPTDPVNGVWVYDPYRILGRQWDNNGCEGGQDLCNPSYGKKAWIMSADMDVYVVDHVPSATEVLSDDEESSDNSQDVVGAFIPVNSDDDDYDTNNTPDVIQVGPIPFESDLVPVIIRKQHELGGHYRFDPTNNLRAWRNADRTDEVTILTLLDASEDHTLYLEGVIPGQVNARLSWISGIGGTTVPDVDVIRFTVFEWMGPLNVPGHSRYEYTTSNALPMSHWESPQGGTIQSGAGTSTVDILWDAGPAVGRAIYKVNDDYVWVLEVNIVQVELGGANQLAYNQNPPYAAPWPNGGFQIIFGSYPSQPAMECTLEVAQVAGPIVQLPGGGSQMRGIDRIEMGFIQNALAIHPMRAEFLFQANPPIGTWYRVISLEGIQQTLDSVPGSVIPWYDSNSAFGTRGYFHAPAGSGALQNLLFNTSDSPNLRPSDIVFMTQGGTTDQVDTSLIAVNFQTWFAVRTLDSRGGSDQIYVSRAEAMWSVNGTGPFDAQGNWTPPTHGTPGSATFTEVMTGDPIPVVTGQTINNLSQNAVYSNTQVSP
jgi:hypothetical protein